MKRKVKRDGKRYYIAYGSNLNVRQMMQRCPSARILGTANLDGWQLLFKGSKTGSYLTIEKRNGSTAPVAVWEITEDDERSLDHYEGYPNFYYKQELTVLFKVSKPEKPTRIKLWYISCTKTDRLDFLHSTMWMFVRKAIDISDLTLTIWSMQSIKAKRRNENEIRRNKNGYMS